MAPPRVLGPSDGHLAILGGPNARFIIEGEDASKRFSLVEHPMQGVERYALVDLGPVGCGMAGAIVLARRHRLHAVVPWASPAVALPSPRRAAAKADAVTASRSGLYAEATPYAKLDGAIGGRG